MSILSESHIYINIYIYIFIYKHKLPNIYIVCKCILKPYFKGMCGGDKGRAELSVSKIKYLLRTS